MRCDVIHVSLCFDAPLRRRITILNSNKTLIFLSNSSFARVFLQNIIMNVVPVGPEPSQVTCPSCRAVVLTKVERKATTRTHIVALVLCLFLCWPCVCVPYCMDSCRNADHYCPNCNSYLGTYTK